jgi:ribosomal-protein-alanine N-acetyltransferase
VIRTQEGRTAQDWRQSLPKLAGRALTLREPVSSDARSLAALLATPEVAAFISTPPENADGFDRFISWTHRRRRDGRYLCFAIVPEGKSDAVGIFQLRGLESGFGTAEWGFAMGSRCWGSGLFEEGARLVVDFAFTQLGTHRLEARAAALNGRGNGACAKLGAMREAMLRSSFQKNGRYLDQNLWTILDEEWIRAKAVWGAKIH